MEKIINTKLILRHKLEAEWLESDYIPEVNEPIIYDIEVDENNKKLRLPVGRTTPYTYQRLKYGDGVRTVNDLPFYGEKMSETELQSLINKLQQHNFEKEVIVHKADCLRTGLGYRVCSDCGEKHFFQIPRMSESNQHQMTGGEPMKQANCCEEGVYYATCDICGYTEACIIAKWPSNHEFEQTRGYDNYNHWLICSGCGEKHDTEAHQMSAWEPVSSTQEIRYCTKNCGYEETREISAQCEHPVEYRHNYTPLDGNVGAHWYDCSLCGTSYAGMEVCNTEATRVKVADDNAHYLACSLCGAVHTDKTSSHKWGTPTFHYDMDYENYHVLTCEECGYDIYEAHDFTELTGNDDYTSHELACTCGAPVTIHEEHSNNGQMLCSVCGHTILD